MGEIVITVIALLLAVYAVADLVGRVAFRLLFSKPTHPEYYVLPLERADDAEYAVRRLSMLRWFSTFENVSFVVVDRGLTDEQRAITDKLCRELRLTFTTEKEWANTLQSTENEVS